MQDYARQSTSALICVPFLDSSVTEAERGAIAAELRRRGIGPVSLVALRVLAGFGLWWNLLAWEWVDLELPDVLFGWSLNIGVLALCATGLATIRLASDGPLLIPVLVALLSAALCGVLLALAIHGWKRRRRARAGTAV